MSVIAMLQSLHILVVLPCGFELFSCLLYSYKYQVMFALRLQLFHHNIPSVCSRMIL